MTVHAKDTTRGRTARRPRSRDGRSSLRDDVDRRATTRAVRLRGRGASRARDRARRDRVAFVPVPVREDEGNQQPGFRASLAVRPSGAARPPPLPLVRRLAPRGDDARVEGLRSQLRRRDGQVPRRVSAGRRRLRRRGKDAAGRFLYDDYESDEDADAALERTRNDLNEKIAQLNAAIDTFAGEADKGLRDGDDDGDDDEGVENENENDEAEATAGKISGE